MMQCSNVRRFQLVVFSLLSRRPWQHFSVRQANSWLALTLMCTAGCGSKPQPTAQSPSAMQPGAAQVANASGNSQAQETSIAKGTKETSQPKTSSVPAEVSGDSSLSDFANASQEPEAGVPSADVPAAIVQQPVAPSPEQLAKWSRPEYEPLQLLAYLESPSIGFVSCMVPLGDGHHFILAGNQVTLWSIDTAQPEHVFLTLTNDESIKSLAVAPNGKWFAAGDSEGKLRIWSIADRKEVHAKKLESNDIIHIAISPNGRELATISYDDQITIWSADQLQQKLRLKVETNSLKTIEYMSAELLVAAGETSTVWNATSGKLERTLSPGRYNYSLALMPDGKRFLFGEQDTLKFWNVAEQKAESTLTGGFATEELLSFSSNGQYLATANGSDIRVWDVANGQVRQVIDTFGWAITGLKWLPDTNLLVVASENARTRIWGTAKDGLALGMKPVHTQVAMPEPGSHLPATPAQLSQVIDLRTFPLMPNVNEVRAHDSFSLNYQVEASLDEAQLFYRYQLQKSGWQELAAEVPTPGALQFQKDGFRLGASFYEAAPAKISVSVYVTGNYDLRWAPKFAGAPIEIVFENEDTVMYRTGAELLQIETELLRKMSAAGWTAYARLHASHSEEEDKRNLSFLQNAVNLYISIDRVPDDPTRFNVQYGRDQTLNSIPIPRDSGFVEFEGSTEPYLVASTNMNVDQTREFYDAQMVAEGWIAPVNLRMLKDETNWLTYLRNQQDLNVGLQKLPSGKTLVRVGEDLENSSWQLAKPKTQDATAAAIGIEAADFPVLNDSKTAKYDGIEKSLEFSMDAIPLLEIGELYTKQMESLGWKIDGSGIRADDYVFLTFKKDKKEVDLRARITGGKSIVNIQGDGILWTKPFPGANKLTSYETWLRTNRYPAGLDLLDQYQAEGKNAPK